jgi:hypothetical protein
VEDEVSTPVVAGSAVPAQYFIFLEWGYEGHWILEFDYVDYEGLGCKDTAIEIYHERSLNPYVQYRFNSTAITFT